MVRIGGAVVLRHVATGTLRGCVSEVARGMASCAVLDLVTTRKREEVVACELCAPIRAHRIMAFDTIRGETGTHVVRGCRGVVFVHVAVDTIVPHTCEGQRIVGRVTIHTARVAMCTDERETILLVQFGDIIHQPGPRCVTTGAVIANGHGMNIRMAGNAIRRYRCIEYHGSVT